MPTTKQKNLAKLRLDHPTMEKGELVELGGYGNSVIKTPSKALESKGYLKELEGYGLTKELVTTALVSDIKEKPKRRVRELELAADILDMRKHQEDSTNNILIVNVTPEGSKKYDIKSEPVTDLL